jgi:5-methylcytosine-specific restriction endonuclease McrA
MSLIVPGVARPMDRDFVAYDFSDWLEYSDSTSEYPVVATSSHKIAIPEIIVLRKYDRLPIRDVKYSRQSLFQRDQYRCGYCGGIFKRDELTVDHIIPRAQKGTTTWQNTITACSSCNFVKADRTPEEAKMPLLFKPRKPQWLSPVDNIHPDHPCKSWLKFYGRVLVE